MAGATVRVREETHSALRVLAREANEPMQEVLTKAVEAYRRQSLIERANAAYARLRQDPEAWASEQAERAIWDGALADDLEME